MAILLLPIMLVVFWSYSFFEPQDFTVEVTMPLYELVQLLEGLGQWVALPVAMVLIYWQAVLLNGVVNNHDFLTRNSTLPAMLLVLYSSIFVTTQGLHPIIFANLFLLLALRRTVAIFRQPRIFSNTFDAGFFIGIASLFYFPSILAIAFLFGSLGHLRSFAWRDYMIGLIGLLVPLLYGLLYWLFTDQLDQLPLLFQFNAIQFNGAFSSLQWIEWLHYLTTGLWLLIVFGAFRRSLLTSTSRERNLKQVVLWLFASVVLMYGYSLFQDAPYRLVILTIPLAIISSFVLFEDKRSWITDLLFYSWMCTGLAELVLRFLT